MPQGGEGETTRYVPTQATGEASIEVMQRDQRNQRTNRRIEERSATNEEISRKCTYSNSKTTYVKYQGPKRARDGHSECSYRCRV